MTTGAFSRPPSTIRTKWRSMNSIRYSPLILIAFSAALAEDVAYVTIYAPSPKVLVSARMQLDVAITDLVGTPIDASGMLWAPSDPAIATVSPQGLVSGVAPGEVTITAADSYTGASTFVSIHVIPADLSI